MKDNSKKRMKRVWDEKRLWIFLVWGIVVVVFGLVAGGVYINLRALTSSEKYTEVIPTYVNFISVIIAGFIVVILFWKRNLVLIFTCILVNVGAAFINGISAILLGTLIIPPINEILHCSFLDNVHECHCLTPYSRSFIQLDYSMEAPVTLIFQDTSNCNNIEKTLILILYTLCGLFVVSAITCIIAVILALLVLRMERRKKLGYQSNTYDEIFTISNSNTPESSDSENNQPVLSHPILPSYNDLARTATDTSDFSRHRSSLQRTYSLKTPKPEPNNLDSIEDNHSDETGTKKGKLKEHRRRDRRAVTLHNLDSKQLMVILSLQMRYLKENENSKSQVELSAKKLDEQLRRSFTPQPYHSRSKSTEPERDINKIRSHTPQPYKTKKQQMYENLQTAQLFYENNIPPWEKTQSVKPSPKNTDEKRKSNHIPHYEDIDDIASCISEDEGLYAEIRNQKKKKIKPKVPTDSEESELSDIPPHRFRRSNRKNKLPDGNLPINIPVIPNTIPNYGRPKSYIKAIDNLATTPEDYTGKPLIHHAQSQPSHLNHHPVTSSELIYAQPVKKINSQATFQRIPDSTSVPVINQNNLYENTTDRRSAFQVVQRSSEAGTGIVGYVDPRTNHNYQLYSAMETKTGQDKPPPYSPPPCYNECLINSRDSSLQSTSSSHHSGHPQDIYGQVNKRKPKFVYTHEPGSHAPVPVPKGAQNSYPSYNSHQNAECRPIMKGNVEPPLNRHHVNIPNTDNTHYASPFRANYVINFQSEQPQVLLRSEESSDSDEMETVI